MRLGSSQELFAFSWSFPSCNVKVLQCRDIHLPAQMEVLMNRSLQKCPWGEDPRHHLPHYLCDMEEFFITEKCNSFPGGQDRGRCWRLQVKSSCLTPFSTGPCSMKLLKKKIQTNKRKSHRHHTEVYYYQTGEEISPL